MTDDYPLYIFLHVHKTGGSTQIAHLSKQLPPEQIALCGESPSFTRYWQEYSAAAGREFGWDNGWQVADAYVRALDEERKRKIRVLIGHYAFYGIHRSFGSREARYILFLRQPEALAISNYLSCRRGYERGYRFPFDPAFQRWITRHGEEFPSLSLCLQEEKNSVTRFLVSRLLGATERKDTYSAEDVQDVCRILDRFYFIGLTERFNEDFMFLCEELGVNAVFSPRNVSSFREKKELWKKNEHTRLLQETVAIDQRIYRHGVRLNTLFRKKNHGLFHQNRWQSWTNRTRLALWRIFS